MTDHTTIVYLHRALDTRFLGWTPMHCAAAEGHLVVFEFLVKEPDADLQAATFEGDMIEDVVEDEDLRQKVIGKSAPCFPPCSRNVVWLPDCP